MSIGSFRSEQGPQALQVSYAIPSSVVRFELGYRGGCVTHAIVHVVIHGDWNAEG